MKIVIYTGISNGYDKLSAPTYKHDGVDYICFTDDPNLYSDVWEVRLIENYHRIDKVVKLFPHKFLPDYDISIWVDANFIVHKPILKLLQYVEKQNMVVFLPPKKHTLQTEFELCIKHSRANISDLQKQQKEYVDFMANLVYACGILIRRHNAIDTKETMLDWWREIQYHTYRDQLSFPVVAAKNNLHFVVIKEELYHNSYFKIKKTHKK